MLAVVCAATELVVTLNVAVVDPAGTSTVLCGVALGLFDERVTVTPPTGADPLMITVPVEGDPPGTVLGFRSTLVG